MKWTTSRCHLTSNYWHHSAWGKRRQDVRENNHFVVSSLFPERQPKNPTYLCHTFWVTKCRINSVLVHPEPGLPAATLVMTIELETKLTSGHHMVDCFNMVDRPTPTPNTSTDVHLNKCHYCVSLQATSCFGLMLISSKCCLTSLRVTGVMWWTQWDLMSCASYCSLLAAGTTWASLVQ